jgi:hypothetical protein
VAGGWGQLKLKVLTLIPPAGLSPQRVTASLAGAVVPATLAVRDGRCVIRFDAEVTLTSGKRLQVTIA